VRRIVETAVDPDTNGQTSLVTLSCGHQRHLNPIYHYRVGEPCRCFGCAQEEPARAELS
jgi:hypothetical protein